jgi:hypothetical protein
MFFSRITEESRLQLLRCGTAGTGAALLVDLREKPARRERECNHLPIAALTAGREQCWPQATMNERHFPADQLGRPAVATGVELLETAENLMRPRMRPPGPRNPFAGDDADSAWQRLVLQKEQTVTLQRRG